MSDWNCVCQKAGYCHKQDTVTNAETLAICRSGTPLAPDPHCVYLGAELPGKVDPSGRQMYECAVHDVCTINSRNGMYARCRRCKERLLRTDPQMGKKYLDPLQVFDRNKQPTTALRNLLAGDVAFLCCGGPSANDNDLSLLNRRGCWSLAVNNMSAHADFIPNAFVCGDPPKKFCDGMWLDPNVMKIIPVPKLTHRKRGRLSRRRNEALRAGCDKCGGTGKKNDQTCGKCGGSGEFDYWFDLLRDDDGNEVRTIDCPNVWAFERTGWLTPDDTFFLHNQAMWGNHDDGVKRTGEAKTVCTMLLGLRLLYHLGARTIYLVGVDFLMDPSRGLQGNYAFDQDRDDGACKSNNEHFHHVNNWLCRMVAHGTFERFGVGIYNTFERSGLRAFPYVPFETAIEHSRRKLPPEPFVLKNWYDQ